MSSPGEAISISDSSPRKTLSPHPSSPPNNTRKRSRDDGYTPFSPDHQDHSDKPDPAMSTENAPSSSQQPQTQQQDQRASSTDLMAPVEQYDWNTFKSRSQSKLSSVESEENQLREEYKKWEWMHEIWLTSRAQSDKLRISQELSTIARWTQLKEGDLEKARNEHTQSLLAISQVLGITPSQL